MEGTPGSAMVCGTTGGTQSLVCVLNVGGAPIFRLFLTTGTCSGHASQTSCLFLDISNFLNLPILDSGVVGLALLAPGCVVTETQSFMD
jgi:hypothetical protein